MFTLGIQPFLKVFNKTFNLMTGYLCIVDKMPPFPRLTEILQIIKVKTIIVREKIKNMLACMTVCNEILLEIFAGQYKYVLGLYDCL